MCICEYANACVYASICVCKCIVHVLYVYIIVDHKGKEEVDSQGNAQSQQEQSRGATQGEEGVLID